MEGDSFFPKIRNIFANQYLATAELRISLESYCSSLKNLFSGLCDQGILQKSAGNFIVS